MEHLTVVVESNFPCQRSSAHGAAELPNSPILENAAIFKQHEQVRFSTAVIAGLRVRRCFEMGADRIMYSTDYPHESMVECEGWFRSVDISLEDQIKIGRLNAMKLLKLEKKLSKLALAA